MELTEHLAARSHQLGAALMLSTSPHAQHTTAQSTVSTLESRANNLECLIQPTQLALSAIRAPPVPTPAQPKTKCPHKGRSTEMPAGHGQYTARVSA